MDSYAKLVDPNATKVETRRHTATVKHVAMALRIPVALHALDKIGANLSGISYNVFARSCMLNVLSRKGA